MNWPRVNRHRPCAICGKPDWCNFNERGSGCMRVESPVQMRNGGWWHPNNLSGGDSEQYAGASNKNVMVGVRASPPAQSLDCEALLRKWRGSQNGQLEPFQDALRALGCVWAGDHRAFAFPMVDAQRRVIGIRLRNERGEKWAVKGSRSGLFMNLILPAVPVLAEPRKRLPSDTSGEARESTKVDRTSESLETRADSRGGRQLLIVEGPTDTAAAIDLGFSVIGRPACLGCEDMIVQMAKGYPGGPLFIIADSDAPGQRGASRLQEKLRKAKIVTLPAKDLRSFVNSGGTREILDGYLSCQL
jgi:5S rRNA maturation endonuclease (ribonuclease M5)